MKFLKTLAVTVLCGVAATLPARAASLEKTDVSIAVGGKVALYYLPLTIAETKGFFKSEGLNVRILDFQGGSKSVEAVVGGSADVLASAYEHMITLQARGQELETFALMGRYPGFALTVSKKLAETYKTPKDLKGHPVGVTAPGSSTNMMLNLVLGKAGVDRHDVPVVGVGAGASVLAAMKNGAVDAVVQSDPATTLLTSSGEGVAVLDTRSAKGTIEAYGGPMPASALSARRSFVEQNPHTVQALANAMVKTLAFLQTAPAAEIYDAMPDTMKLADRDFYLKLIDTVRPSYSPDGVLSKEAAETALRALKSEVPAVRNASIDLSKTYTNSFVTKSPKGK